MKKIYLISMLSIVSLNLYCQQENAMVLDSTYGYYWVSETNDWAHTNREMCIPFFKFFWGRQEYSYDANGNLTKKTRFFWDSQTNDWVMQSHEINSYDANGNLTNKFGSGWDEDLNFWEKAQYREVFTYDANRNLTEKIISRWYDDHNDWVMEERFTYAYDSNGIEMELLYFRFSSEDNYLRVSHQIVYTYDSIGNLTEKIRSYWDNVLKEWKQAEYREVFTYDANGNETEQILYRWGSETNDWMMDERVTNAYDANGNLTERIRYGWDRETDDWVRGSRSFYTYYANGNETEQILYRWDSETNDWIYDLKEVSYWSKLTTSFPTKSYELNFKIFPNPTTNIITIETDHPGQNFIAITSLNGQLLFSDKMEGPTHQIDLSAFEKGLYFITVRSRDYVRTEKIIKL